MLSLPLGLQQLVVAALWKAQEEQAEEEAYAAAVGGRPHPAGQSRRRRSARAEAPLLLNAAPEDCDTGRLACGAGVGRSLVLLMTGGGGAGTRACGEKRSACRRLLLPPLVTSGGRRKKVGAGKVAHLASRFGRWRRNWSESLLPSPSLPARVVRIVGSNKPPHGEEKQQRAARGRRRRRARRAVLVRFSRVVAQPNRWLILLISSSCDVTHNHLAFCCRMSGAPAASSCRTGLMTASLMKVTFPTRPSGRFASTAPIAASVALSGLRLSIDHSVVATSALPSSFLKEMMLAEREEPPQE